MRKLSKTTKKIVKKVVNKTKVSNSGYKGVYKVGKNSYRAQIWTGSTLLHIGMYNTPESAYRAYNKAKRSINSITSL